MLFCLLIIIAGIGLYVLLQFGALPSDAEKSEYSKLSYYKNAEFQSPEKLVYDFNNIRNSNGNSGFFRFLWQSSFAPKEELPKVMLSKDSFPSSPEAFALYWLGHSSAIIDLNGKRILIDPVFGNAAPIPFAVPRYGKAPISVKELPKIDYILITHNHYDHLEKSTVQAIKSGHFIVPLGVGAALRGWGIAKDRITELGWKDSFKQDGLKIIAREAVHFSGRTFKRNQTLWNAYVILSPDMKIFWGGDSGYGKHFSAIGKEYGPFDLTALEIDGWNTGWPNTHMFPKEVIQAANDLQTKTLLPVHWAVFDLALHPWHESIDMVIDEAKSSSFNITTPKMGEKINLHSKTSHWWKDTD
ncbi:MAG: MBL fold metallo-hydrolase [Alphaproteobacteria bacterium]|nr:MBL fold metallo-hydrolase [Alphaproteobacteria bacterium]